MHGYEPEELHGRDHLDLIHPEQREIIRERADKILKGEEVRQRYEIKRLKKDGEVVWHEIMVSDPITYRGRPAIMGHEIDLTKRKWAEQALKESEEKYRGIFENGSDLLCLHDLEGNLIDTNVAFKTHYGWNEDELVNANLRDFIPDRYKHEFEEYLKRVKENGKDEGLMRVMDKDGRELIIEYRNSLARDSQGIPIGVHGSARDITRRLQAEKALRKSEEKYRELVEDINDVLFATDEIGIITYISPRIESVVGYSPSEGIGRSFAEFIHPDDLARIARRFEELLSGNLEPSEYRLVGKSGEIRWVRTSSRPIFKHDRVVGLRGLLVDITESKRLQAKLQEAKKMEAISTLAGGIAHQFNNALTTITGHIGLLEMGYGQDRNVMECTKEMKQSAHRMANLTSQLLAYARGGKYNPVPMSLTVFLADTLPLLQHILAPAVRVETDLPQDIMNVEADLTQMQMVVSAMVANSNEAIEGPGRIRISTRNMDLDREFVKGHPDLKPGPYVCLSIEDYGKGMDEETKNRIFEPFFTTHFIGRGLSMPAAYGIVKNHGGEITVDSEPGKGTVVRIYLPGIEAKKEVENKVVSEPKGEPSRGEGTILVIEDEESLMKMNRQILERLGYRVLEARNGAEAVELAKTFDGQIDLALLDIKLPDIPGDKVYPLIMEARPSLKVIVCSGYVIDGPAQDILDAGAQAFIQKPFTISTLAGKFKEVLGKR